MSASNSIRILTPFPAPGVPGAPYFNGANITLFLDRFKLLGENYYINDSDLVKKLPDYCEPEIREEIRTLAGYDQQDWSQIRKQLRERFYKNDIYQQMYSKSFLEAFKDQPRTMEEDIEAYCSMFRSVSANLVERDMLDNHTRCCWFLLGLPKKMRSKFMEKYDIDPEDPSTLNFEELYTAAVKKAKRTEFEHSLTKAMGESALRELNRRKESPMRSDAVIVRADGTFPSRQQPEPAEKSKSKTVPNAVIQSQLDDLSSKAEILQLNISSLSESLE